MHDYEYINAIIVIITYHIFYVKNKLKVILKVC